jgi:deoxycytidylate deaminase
MGWIKIMSIKNNPLFRIPKWFKMARKESFKSDYHVKIGCVVVSGNRLMSKGHNKIRHKSKGVFSYSKWEESLHAERDALTKMKKEKIKGCDVFVYREYANGHTALAKPCKDCMNMLIEMEVRKIFYTTHSYPYYQEIKL